MNNERIFEAATRAKMRFPFKGMISVEDLWDLSVENLDVIFKTLNSQLKQSQEESLLNKRTKHETELDIQIEIVKYIVSVKLEEERVRTQAKEQKEKKQKIMEIIASKQDADLQNKSLDELKNMLGELEN